MQERNANALLALVAAAIGVWAVLTWLVPDDNSKARERCDTLNAQEKRKVYGNRPEILDDERYDVRRFVNGYCEKRPPRG